MPPDFRLIIEPDPTALKCSLRLFDVKESLLATHQINFHESNWQYSQSLAIFDLAHYIEHYVWPTLPDEATDEEACFAEACAVADCGVNIAHNLLGIDIFTYLYQSTIHRTLHIELPAAYQAKQTRHTESANAKQYNHFIALLARVPWEMARPRAEADSLYARKMAVCITSTQVSASPTQIGAHSLAITDEIRILFVFAEALGATPLNMRQERRALLELFQTQIYPTRKVTAQFLAHGVTHEQLLDTLTKHKGFHILHWSGHGAQNVLELAEPGGKSKKISGEDLLKLFLKASGTVPRLCFISACHSGNSSTLHNWDDFLQPPTQHPHQVYAHAGTFAPMPAPTKAEQIGPLATTNSLPGTAHTLLIGGVHSVIAMRYAVGDDYARELAIAFYRALLADKQPKTVAIALHHARESLRHSKKYQFSACDHATPMLYGGNQTGLEGKPEPSPNMNLAPRCLPDPTSYCGVPEFIASPDFVGRTWQLAAISSEVLDPCAIRPVAQITGLGGMGKTSLAAEVINIWQARFDWVLLFRASPNELILENFFHQAHMHLNSQLGRYHQHINNKPDDAIYRNAASFTEPVQHLSRLMQNLVRAMRDEAILLVLDNLETNLQSQPYATKIITNTNENKVWQAKDPAWDQLLSKLTHELTGSHSRVLITCRKPLAVLAQTGALHIPIGPLHSAEARLYLFQHPALAKMLQTPLARQLAQRLLQASRFHPLLMNRLTHLASDPTLRSVLKVVLQRLENQQDYASLPELLANHHAQNQTNELAYLQDALQQSIDDLIVYMEEDARYVLWLVSLTNEELEYDLLEALWRGESLEMEQLRSIQRVRMSIDQLPPDIANELIEDFNALPAELHEQILNLPPIPIQADLSSLLHGLLATGLLQIHHNESDLPPSFTCHELVRERISFHFQESETINPAPLWHALAERLFARFEALEHQDISHALQVGYRAVVYAMQAQEYVLLSAFAGKLITSSKDAQLCENLIPYFQSLNATAPNDIARMYCQGFLADALHKAGRSEESFPLYEAAAQFAQGHDVGEYAAICSNWAGALLQCGHLAAARELRLASASAFHQAGSPAINIIGCEMEALRIDILQGEVDVAMQQIVEHLPQLQTWLQQHQNGETVPEAPDATILTRIWISSLDIAKDGAFAKRDWPTALFYLDEMLECMQSLSRSPYDIGNVRMNRASVLMQLKEFSNARQELEACLPLFQADPYRSSGVLFSLADLFSEMGDVQQAIVLARRALAIRNDLPSPQDRAGSHHNLAKYLIGANTANALAEYPYHQLAALLYRLCAGLKQHLQDTQRNYFIDFRQSYATRQPLRIPTIADLLAQPGFHSIKQWITNWLAQNGVTQAQLQEETDQYLADVRSQALEVDIPNSEIGPAP